MTNYGDSNTTYFEIRFSYIYIYIYNSLLYDG